MSQKFEAILLQIQTSNKAVKTTPKKILDSLGLSRRGANVIKIVRELSEKYAIIITPDFATCGAYAQIELSSKPKVLASSNLNSDVESDLTPRLKLLGAADLASESENNTEKGLYVINREARIQEAISIMMMYDFSQLPVLSGKKDVDGLISWKSIGRALALGKKCEKVGDCLDEVTILDLESALFSAVKIILDKEVVLVRKRDKSICGILTATDVGQQFITLSEPFLVLEQIEKHIRIVLHGKLTLEEIEKVIDIKTLHRPLTQLSDLSFGHYIRIIESQALFGKLKINIDRVILVNKLEEVRKIRNSIMHFNPEKIMEKDLLTLRHTLNFFTILSHNV